MTEASTGRTAPRGSAGAVDSAAGPVIVVGYSTKPEGRAALRRSLTEARLRGARLVVVRTSPDAAGTELDADLASSGVAYEVATPAEELDPAEELMAAADRTGAEFIVIGLRRRSPLGKLLLGSNAQRVLLGSRCPVMAVKPE